MKQSKPSYRSRFEEKIAESLKKRKVKFKYEERSYPLVRTTTGFCKDCGSSNTGRNGRYLPDWFIYRNGNLQFIIETKGKFTASNRQTMLAFKEQYPSLDIRLLFMKNNKLSKSSKTTYGEWADKHGFLWAVGDLPDEWF